MSTSITLFGAVCIVAAIVAGDVTLVGNKIPKLTMRQRIASGVLGILLIGGGQWERIKGLWTSAASAPTQQISSQRIDLSGFVVDEAGTRIANARVQTNQDNAAPESTYTDSTGNFTVRVKSTAGTVTVTVIAKGYQDFSSVQPIERTTPLKVILVSVPPAGSKENGGVVPPSQHRPGIPAPTQLVPPGPTMNDHGIINNGPINGGSQTVQDNRVYGAPAPPPDIVGLRVTALAAIPAPQMPPSASLAQMQAGVISEEIMRWKAQAMNYDQRTGKPGVAITFHLSRAFRDPMFEVVCDRPCVGLDVGLGAGGYSGHSPFFARRGDRILYFNLGDERYILPDVAIGATVRSQTDEPLEIVSVKGFVE